VGIVGGGLAGVACAWLLDGVADAVLFESRSEIGGHAHTLPVDVNGRTLLVDVGAQFFARGPHPTYSKLLELIGLGGPDVTLESEMTITVTEAGRKLPRFVSPNAARFWPILAPWNFEALLAFFFFVLAAKSLTQTGDWLLPLDRWLATLPVSPEVRENLLLPLVSAMVGCSIDEARGLSARSAVLFVGQAVPDNLLAPILYNNSRVGLGGNVRYLAGLSGNLTTHKGALVRSVHPLPHGAFAIRNAAGVAETVDVVIFATPPYVTRTLLPQTQLLRETRAILRGFEYFRTEIAIHRDPVYMPSDPALWSAYNARIEGGFSEASVWYGALRGDSSLSIFKSWATARSRAPRKELFRRTFLHPRVTPEFIEAGRLLSLRQGLGGIWFAGSYTGEVDSQETALRSAMNVVRELVPDAPNLLALEGS
jgi:predicted NAD/FAD-binding protein